MARGKLMGTSKTFFFLTFIDKKQTTYFLFLEGVFSLSQTSIIKMVINEVVPDKLLILLVEQ